MGYVIKSEYALLLPSDFSYMRQSHKLIMMETSDGAGLGDAPAQRRGRVATRSATPGTRGHRSRGSGSLQSPAASSSPTSVLPSPPVSKGGLTSALRLLNGAGNAGQEALLLSPEATPTRPPGFEATTPPGSPVFHTPPSSPTRTPVLPHVSPLARTPTRSKEGSSPSVRRLPGLLFAPAQQPLLSPPTSSPPLRPVNRRKTLAGMSISRTLGFSLKQAALRNKARRRAAPVARKAEAVLCRGLGIIKDGEEVTQQAMEEFAARFQGQVTQEVIDAMRVLFNIGSDDEDEVDQAIIQDGGEAALELAQEEDCTADV